MTRTRAIDALRGLRRTPRPFVFLAVVLLTSRVGAQDPVRPWLDWRTIQTPHYRIHFPREFEPFARAAAARVESVDSAIASLVGSTSPRPVHVVIDDPFSISNGYALPAIDMPVSVWWALPPDPRNDIGDFRTWYEMLSVHELTHIAHLTRQSRNPFQRHIWESLPTNLGPLVRKTPRWVYEGYATVIEGRITGTGRPNNAWRPAILRQWAIEGRLPSYGQLNGSPDFNGGEFAYLGGSAFLEWLMRRQGDSSLVAVWRRLSARKVRSFDGAFRGVYGDIPALLYGRHTAELTRDAMAAKADLERAGIVEGELVQRLAWDTGDPAISPDGSLVAVTLRERERPSKVVVWRTTPEVEDTAAIRRRIEALKRDPQDVPDRRFYPLPKRPVKALSAVNGRAFSEPRWFADNKRLLVTRWVPRTDGSYAPDLYVWSTETGDVNRVTQGAAVSHGDPFPDGKRAIATQCRWGHCDIVRVDLSRGTVTTLMAGDAETSYYRPRLSPDGSRLLASVSRGGAWQIVIADADGRQARTYTQADGANRYDASWFSGDTAVLVSERGGVPNLELLSLASGETRTLTRVTGAAVAPDMSRADSSVWFLSMQSIGFDVRRLSHGAHRADSVVSLTADKFGFAGVQSGERRMLGVRPVGESRAYGVGPRHGRWLPGAFASVDGVGGTLTVFTGDLIGRLNGTITGALGQDGTWQGGSARFAWRFPRPQIEFGGDAFIQEPSRARGSVVPAGIIDGSLVEGIAATGIDRRGDGWRYRARLGAAVGKFSPTAGKSFPRRLGFGEVGAELTQSRGSTGVIGSVDLHGTIGRTDSSYQRVLGTFRLATTGRDALPFEAGFTVGRINGAPHPFELFTIGGVATPLSDAAVLSQRFPMPEFPTGLLIGDRLFAWRVAIPGPWTWYLEGASVTMTNFNFEHWQRAVGVEARFGVPPIPVAFTPAARMRAGAAYTLDQPLKARLRAYLEMTYAP